MQYCSLQHLTLLPSAVTSTTGCCFCFDSTSSFFLELFLHWSLVAYQASTDLGSSSFSVLSFCLLILFMEASRKEYWSGLLFASPVDHILSELSTMTFLSWVALHGMAHSFIEPDKFQDGGLEGRRLISSCMNSKIALEHKNFKITTRCWTTIDRKMLDPTKKDTPRPRAKEKPQQDLSRGEIAFRIKPHNCQRHSEGSNKLCAQQDPMTPKRLSQNCVWVYPVEVWISSGLLQGNTLGAADLGMA